MGITADIYHAFLCPPLNSAKDVRVVQNSHGRRSNIAWGHERHSDGHLPKPACTDAQIVKRA